MESSCPLMELSWLTIGDNDSRKALNWDTIPLDTTLVSRRTGGRVPCTPGSDPGVPGEGLLEQPCGGAPTPPGAPLGLGPGAGVPVNEQSVGKIYTVVVTTEGSDKGDGVGTGQPAEPESRGGSDMELEGCGNEDVGPGSGVLVGISDEPAGSEGGSDEETVGLGAEILPRLPVELGSSGVNDDSVLEGSGSGVGCGDTVGSELLELFPSSRLITRPLARTAKRREETIALVGNMIFERISWSVKTTKKKGNRA